MSPVEEVSERTAIVDTIEEVKDLLSRINSKEALDILHFLRIRYSKELFKQSHKTRSTYEEKIRNIHVPKRAGAYLILVVDPEGDIILYAGKTSGRSKTSGLEFRVRDHIRLLGKTPLTLFVPNWWIKRIYTMTVEDKKKATRLERQLWIFSCENAKGKTRFNSLHELEKELFKILNQYIKPPNEIRTIELQPNLDPKPNFLLRYPPAGEPRGSLVSDEKC